MKAIEVLRTLKNVKYVDDFIDKSDNTVLIRITQKTSEWVKLDEALAELEALQTKLQSLEQYCKEQIREQYKWGQSDFHDGEAEAYEDILNKIRV